MLTANITEQEIVFLDNKELFFLAGILGSDRLLGIEDPFQGLLSEEISLEWENVKQSLLDKGYLIQGDTEAELLIRPEIFAKVAIVGLAERACWLRYLTDDATFEGYVHITNEKVVESTRASNSNNMHKLSELGNVLEACNSLVERMNWRTESPSNLPALMLSKKVFRRLYENRDLSVDQLSSELLEATGDLEGAMALAKSLHNKTAEGELRLSVWTGDKWETQGAAYIVGESMNWLFRMSMRDEEDWLVATPATRSQLEDMLLLWFEHQSETEEG